MIKLPEKYREKINKDGYVFLKKYNEEESTESIARSISDLVNLEKIMPESGIPTVHKVNPKKENEANNHSYSSKYGLQQFPFHTDLAHWAIPPRYIMLRCIKGDINVSTLIFTPEKLKKLKTWLPIDKAFFAPRKSLREHSAVALPMAFSFGGVDGVRWDKDFIIPINKEAREVRDGIDSYIMGTWKPSSVIFGEPGDTIIIDNWRCLHSRTAVPENSERMLERVYLEGNV